jgi:hypothetical protein
VYATGVEKFAWIVFCEHLQPDVHRSHAGQEQK